MSITPTALLGSLVLTLDTPEILDALAALEVHRARRVELDAKVDETKALRDARPTGKGSRTIARAYSRALGDLDEHVNVTMDFARRDLEMAVRAANPDAPQRVVMDTVRAL